MSHTLEYCSSETPVICNGFNRRRAARVLCQARISTFWNDARLQPTPVIECSLRGARVVLDFPAQVNDNIGVVVESAGRRLRTFARVAWTTTLETSKTVAGLEFLDLA